MDNIELTELPESKEFMKYAKIADGLTKETGLEHGFIFCKPNNKIIVDKMCVGDECSIEISAEKCNNNNSFHTHPKKDNSMLSHADIYNSADKSYFSGESSIYCIKGENSKNIQCEKITPPPEDKMMMILDEYEKVTDKRTEDIFRNKAYKITTPPQIIFDSKTKEILSYHYMY